MSGQFSLIRLFFPLIIAISLPLTVFLVYQNTDSRQHASEEATLHLVPDVQSTQSGQNISYALSLDSKKVPVKSLQINISYPAHKVDIAEIDTSNSPFDLPLEEITGNGVIRLGREATTPIFGEQSIAIIHFKAKDTMNANEVITSPGTQILSLENNNIYKNALSRTLPQHSQVQNESIINRLVNAFQNIFK